MLYSLGAMRTMGPKLQMKKLLRAWNGYDMLTVLAVQTRIDLVP